MKRLAYLLIFLTFWAQFDDLLLTPASAFQSAPSDDGRDRHETEAIRARLGRRLTDMLKTFKTWDPVFLCTSAR